MPIRRRRERGPEMEGQIRSQIHIGATVDVVLKKDQGTCTLTRGTVSRILTNSPKHPRGIKVMLSSGLVGRVQNIVEEKNDN